MLLPALMSQTFAHRAMLYVGRVILRPLLSGSTADCMRCTRQLPVWCTPTNPGPLPLPACQTPRENLAHAQIVLQHINTALARCMQMQTVSLLQQQYTMSSAFFFWPKVVTCRLIIFLSATTLCLQLLPFACSCYPLLAVVSSRSHTTAATQDSSTTLLTLLSWIASMWMIVLVAHQLQSLHQL